MSLVRLVGMMLIVFVKNKHMDHVKNVATDTVGTGIMGKLVNCYLNILKPSYLLKLILGK